MEEKEEPEVSFALDHFSDVHYKEICTLIDELPKYCVGDQFATERERSFERCRYILNLYQEQPHLLDLTLLSIVDKLVRLLRSATSDGNRQLFFQCFHYLRLLMKLRRYKSFARFLPHDFSDLTPVLLMLEERYGSEDDPQMATDVYVADNVLLVWMSMLCKIPFDFSRFDYSSGDSTVSSKPTSQRIYDAVKRRLFIKDQRRELAAYCLSIFVARPDSVRQYLHPLIFNDILPFLDNASKDYSDFQGRYGINPGFILSAQCMLLAGLLKHVQREEISFDWSKRILDELLSLPALLAESADALVRKWTTKAVVRTTLTMLKPKLAAWRYERGSRSLATGLASSKPEESSIDSFDLSNGAELEEHFDVPEIIESVVDHLLAALKDKDTTCRWSAAKGFGRLCARLPYSLADQIVSAILEFFRDTFADASRDGACLALAELGRRGLLLPARFSEVIPIVVRALTYDEQRGTYSVGSNVRDAACYVCWSFARAYAPTELRPYNRQLAIGLLTTAVYDREVKCRRAASAAFQEHIGRQRGEFPHGIDLLTAVDYFAVGNRRRCYRELSGYVATFPEYTQPMIDHLLEQKISHWDEDIRRLSGDALRLLSSIAPSYIVSNVVPKLLELVGGRELFACHGAVIALGRSATILRPNLSSSLIQRLFDIPAQLMNSRLYKGVGGELLRKAMNDYIYNCSSLLQQTTLESDAKRRYADVYKSILDENLVHQKEEIRQGAHQAANALFGALPPSDVGAVEIYIRQMEKALYERERIGGCFALSALPRSLLDQHREVILAALLRFSTSSEHKRSPDSLWAVSRRDCVRCLAAVVDKLGVDDEDGLSANELELVTECYMKALDDYTTDNRGDIGSLVREASALGLKELFSQILRSKTNRLSLSGSLSKRAVEKMLQQCCEKIDRTRASVCGNMESLAREAGTMEQLETVLRIPRSDVLMDVFASEKVHWAEEKEAYAKLIGLLDAGDQYAYSVLLGFAVTAGGLIESTARASSDALLAYCGRIQSNNAEMSLIVSTLVSIFSDYRKIDRVTLPLMKTIDKVFSCNYLDDLPLIDGGKDWLERLLDLCVAETKLSKNSQKVLIGLSLCNCFLRYEGTAIADKALQYILSMLVHQYPLIRREAASRLYESVLSHFSLDNHNEQVLSLLSETDWDVDPNGLEDIRNELLFFLKVQ